MTATSPLPSVAHTVADVEARRGGPSRSIPALCAAVAEAGVPTTLVTWLEDDATLPGVPVHRAGRGLRAYSRAVREAAARHDLVHDHGLWRLSNLATGRAAASAGRPLVVSPRGMLEPQALRRRSWKKRAAWVGYQRALLRSAAALHATSESEAEGIREAGVRCPIAVIPNGVQAPDDLPPRSRGDTRHALFLSRLHPIKGLPLLIEAWADVRPDGWTLLVAGPDDGGHRAEVERLVAEAGLTEVVRFLGPVDDDDKWALYRSADLFVLPTQTENFGLVIAEALAAAVPVLTTTGAPWPVLREEALGWWEAPRPRPFAAALRDATSRTPEDLAGRGERGRAYVRQSLGWDAIGARMAAVYRWLVFGGERPADVVL